MQTMELFNKQSPTKGIDKEMAQTQELHGETLGATDATLAGTNMIASSGFPKIDMNKLGRNS